MHGLVLAGGEGSRLRGGGIAVPKALVRVAGRQQIVRVIESLIAVGCETVTCVVRSGLPEVEITVNAVESPVPVQAVVGEPPTSLHSLAIGLDTVPSGPVFCSMVDTVMRSADWRHVADASATAITGGADVALAVTTFVDDESPLWAETDEAMHVVGLRNAPPARYVTGGLYAFADDVRPLARRAVERGVVRMRGFLQSLIADGRRMVAIDVPRIVDVDRPADLDAANAWLRASSRDVS